MMGPPHLTSFVIVGAGAAGLMTARELARAGKGVTILEARDRCGGRIWPLPVGEFGYPAEGGAEFVHGAARVTRALMREAHLSLSSRAGTRWSTRAGTLSPDESSLPHAGRFYQALRAVKADLPIAQFLEAHFAGREYERLRRAITRMVEGYDAADPSRISTFAIRDEWTARDEGQGGRLAEGYGALVKYLESECRVHGAAIHLDAIVTALEYGHGGIVARCQDGAMCEADAVVLTLPAPLLTEIALPSAAHKRAAAAADIGFGNVIKILLRFATNWWTDYGGLDLADLSFLISDATIPTWWTQYPSCQPVMTGWFAGPKAEGAASSTAAELVEMGLTSLAEIFELPADRLRRDLVASRAINWGNDPFARGAYSYATPRTRAAQASLGEWDDGTIFFAGEALYGGPDMGTVEAALASGLETARAILAKEP